MHYEIIDCYFNIFFVEIQLKKTNKLEKCFLGTRAWAPKLVHWSPKQPGYVPVIMRSGNYGRKENGNESKEKYLEAKKKDRRPVDKA